MHRAFRQIYAEARSAYRVLLAAPTSLFPIAPGAADHLDLVVRAIENVAAEFPNYQIREDGLLFLTVNLHQMAALPIAHDSSPTPFGGDFAENLVLDVRRIVQTATRFSEAEGRTDVAASHLLRATSEELDDLHLKSWRLWDREEP